MSSEGTVTPKVSSSSGLGPTSATGTTKNAPVQRQRRSRVSSEKKIADDELMAAAIGDVEWLKQSLRDGKHLIFDKNGLTALHLASIHGRLECLKLCIDKIKIDINLPSSTGWRAIHLVISNQTGKRSLQCLTYLLEKKPDVVVCNEDGITPVHQAASEGHVQCLKLLIEHGADVHARDCRDNTPLDLAKLWGHRKCARILAAEMWHQNKDYVAKELSQLKKLKMQHVLQEIEDDEEFQAIRDDQKEKAFQQWLKERNLEEKPTGPQPKEDQQQGLQKANSKQSEGVRAASVAFEEKSTTPTSAASWKRETLSSGLSGDMYRDYDEDESKKQREVSDVTAVKPPPKSEQYINPNPWNKYAKMCEKEYLPVLKDFYPRDEYTMMPKLKSFPKYYTGKFEHLLTMSDIDVSNKPSATEKLRKPDLPKDVIQKELAKDPSSHERPIVFKPKCIYDVVTKRKYDPDVIPSSETPMHLSDDFRSFLVKNSIKISVDESEASCSSGSPNLDAFPRELVANTIKQMSKPDCFPNIQGPEYEINFGDISGVF
ncbi:ankyrin repeat domain-containing protein 53-like [Gigantopelta aegis]|uniref:ankyrin repeat domain-containing protein 53-like n=1 Tax=Gigantopelta aegis TaxID=1735272 RepID=UPI001B88B919|nr:ankyrin repeat domain-containing protein 53-like [Gigantopelta aegis]